MSANRIELGGEQSLGRYTFLFDLAHSYLGALSVARIKSGADEGALRLIRRMSTRAPVNSDAIDELSEAAFWSMEVARDGVAKSTDVVLGDGQLGVVMEYAEGEPLRSLMQGSRSKGSIPHAVALRIVLDAIDGLHFVHLTVKEDDEADSYAHGGFTPDSVLVGVDGKVTLVDVAISGVASQLRFWRRMPERAPYHPPERFTDELHVDERSDVFAVGVLLWEMLASRPLFEGTEYRALSNAIVSDPIPHLDDENSPAPERVPSPLANVVARALTRDPASRFDGLMDMASEIRATGERVAGPEELAAFVDHVAAFDLARRRLVIEGKDDAPSPMSIFPSVVPRPAASHSTMPPGPIPPAGMELPPQAGLTKFEKVERAPDLEKDRTTPRLKTASAAPEPEAESAGTPWLGLFVLLLGIAAVAAVWFTTQGPVEQAPAPESIAPLEVPVAVQEPPPEPAAPELEVAPEPEPAPDVAPDAPGAEPSEPSEPVEGLEPQPGAGQPRADEAVEKPTRSMDRERRAARRQERRKKARELRPAKPRPSTGSDFIPDAL